MVLSSDVFSDGQAIYDAALERLDAIRDAWRGEGMPLTASGSMGQVIEHPLVKLLRATELEVVQIGQAIAKRHRGPEPKAVVAARIGKAPSAAKLKAVKTA